MMNNKDLYAVIWFDKEDKIVLRGGIHFYDSEEDAKRNAKIFNKYSSAFGKFVPYKLEKIDNNT